MIRRAALAGLILALALSPPVNGAEPGDNGSESALKAFQQKDMRLFAVGWRLARANAPYCADTHPSIGLLLHDAAAYSDPAALRDAFGLTGDIAVEAVAPGSPAERAGLRVNDTLVEIGGRAIGAEFPAGDKRWQRTVAIHDALDARLAEGPVDIAWARPGAPIARARIAGVPACRARFEVLDSSDDASADGLRVLMGHRFAAFGYPEDEFAAAIAHEMAHNLVRHTAKLATVGRKGKFVRLAERDADRLMPWFLQNAGYDPHAASRFMAKWGPRYGGGLIRKRSHDGWDERVEFIEAEIAAMQRHLDAQGKADWARFFRSELDSAIER